MHYPIPFNKPFMTGKELEYIQAAHSKNKLSGDGFFSKQCQQWLEQQIGCKKALLTHSCTAALDMSAMLIDAGPGDEIIMPSYTFVSTANAFVLRGATPVFIDIRPDTLNIDETQIEAAITPKTKAIVVVHYAGVGCNMAAITAIAEKHGLYVIEDAAQGLMSSYQNQALGSFGQLAAISFHDTKNIISGEGGALLINDEKLAARAEIIREKGTDRSRFLRGEIDKYTWVDIGSSYIPSEITAAFLWAQLQAAAEITQARLAIWAQYHAALEEAAAAGLLQRPHIPADCQHNAHMYYILLPDAARCLEVIAALKARHVQAVAHYVPLHSAPAGRKFSRTVQPSLPVTDSVAACIARLPLWVGLEEHIEEVIEDLRVVLSSIPPRNSPLPRAGEG